MATLDLFANVTASAPSPAASLAPGAFILPAFALALETPLLSAIASISQVAPFRHMTTPGGFRMSVAMSNAGTFGWLTDRSGYRYSKFDPLTGQPWPPIPEAFLRIAKEAAATAGYGGFLPDACLINRYEPGAKMSLHQDKDEHDMAAPIVSVSLGLPAMFQFGGFDRSDRPSRIPLAHGDVVVWGGESRLRYHGILPLKAGVHAQTGAARYNLTFRKAG